MCVCLCADQRGNAFLYVKIIIGNGFVLLVYFSEEKSTDDEFDGAKSMCVRSVELLLVCC